MIISLAPLRLLSNSNGAWETNKERAWRCWQGTPQGCIFRSNLLGGDRSCHMGKLRDGDNLLLFMVAKQSGSNGVSCAVPAVCQARCVNGEAQVATCAQKVKWEFQGCVEGLQEKSSPLALRASHAICSLLFLAQFFCCCCWLECEFGLSLACIILS